MQNNRNVLSILALVTVLLVGAACAPAGEREIEVPGPITTIELHEAESDERSEGDEVGEETADEESMSSSEEAVGDDDDTAEESEGDNVEPVNESDDESDDGAESETEIDDESDAGAGETSTSEVMVFFSEPADGAEVTSPFQVVMAADDVEVAPAGELQEGTGHMHILINTDFIAPGEVIPADDSHRHFGDGSTETELILPPGEHVLRLQLADGAHRAFEGDQYRDEITITVIEASE